MENDINDLNESLEDLKQRMKNLGDKVDQSLWDEYNEIKNLIKEAKSFLEQGDYNKAKEKYEDAYSKYLSLLSTIEDLEERFMKGAGGLSTVLIGAIVTAVVAGIAIGLWKLGYLKIKFREEEEEGEWEEPI